MIKNKYFAFISYKYEDTEWAMWLHHEIENYILPTALSNRSDIPHTFRPVFRDADELKVGSLPLQLHEALSQSANLIVICSPMAAQSQWVNKEILDFVESGKQKGVDNVSHIFPFIVDGKPHSADKSQECFPPALLDLCRSNEIYGSDVNDYGRDKAFVKIMAGMLQNVDFDELWNRYEKQKAEEERLKREERNKFLTLQSRFVAEKIKSINHDSSLAQLLALSILPENLADPNRPYTIEAESALRYASSKKNFILKGHTFPICEVAVNTEATRLVSVADDGTMRIWNLDTGIEIKRVNFPHTEPFPGPDCAIFSHDDSAIIAGFRDGRIQIWSTDNYDLISEFNLNALSDDININSLHSLALTSNDLVLACASLNGDFILLNLETTDFVYREISPIHSIAFSPDDEKIVILTDTGVTIWFLQTGDNASIDFNKDATFEHASAAFSPDGNKVALICDAAIGIIDINIGKLHTFKDNKYTYVSMAFCHNSDYIIAVTADGLLVCWNINTSESGVIDSIEADNVNNAVYNAATDSVAIVFDKNDILFKDLSVKYSKIISTNNFINIGAIAYSQDGKYIASSSAELDAGWIQISDISTGESCFNFQGHKDRVFALSYSHNGKFLLSASYDGKLCIWDSATAKILFEVDSSKLIGESSSFIRAVFSPDDRYVAAAFYSGEVVIWDYVADNVVKIFHHSINPLFGFAYSPDGTKVVSGSINRDLKIWDIANGNLMKTINDHTDIVQCAAYSPDGRQLLSAGYDKAIICRDAQSYNILWHCDFNGAVVTLDYSSDGKYIVVGVIESNHIIILDSLTGHVVYSIPWSATLMAYEYIQCVRFNPNGQSFAVATNHGLYVWNFPQPQQLIYQAQEKTKSRKLTDEEKRKYYLE